MYSQRMDIHESRYFKASQTTRNNGQDVDFATHGLCAYYSLIGGSVVCIPYHGWLLLSIPKVKNLYEAAL